MGLYFSPEVRKWAFKKFCWFHFTANQGHQELVQSRRDWKITLKFREIGPKLVKITMRVRRSRATLSVLKWSGAIFRPRSSTPGVRFFYMCPFHPKIKTSGVSLESPGLENIPQFSLNRDEVGQNHEPRKAASAKLSVLKWSGAPVLTGRSKGSVEKLLLCLFHCKSRPSGVSLEFSGLKNIP